MARQPTRLDWRIIHALRGRATRPLADVAAELGVSVRTVSRRYERMWADGMIDTVARLNTGNVPGQIPEKFYFSIRDDAVAQQVQRVEGERVSLMYEQHRFVPFSCFGETEYFVTGVRGAK